MPITPAQLKALSDSFDWDKWNTKIRSVIDDGFRDVALEQGEKEADAYDLEWNPEDPFVDRWFTNYVGERITQIDETTRDTVRDELQSAYEDAKADSMQDLAGRLREVTVDSAAFSPARALMIARTETAIAYNTGALLAYRQNDVDQVEVSDGDEDEECAEADGEIWDLDEAMANPTAHPNCRRSFAPVLPEPTATDDGGE